MLNTIGYEKAQLTDFVQTLGVAEVDIVIDIRDRAQSRRKGFSKTALSEALLAEGIKYKHLRNLGDPKDGREAARRGDFDGFRKIFAKVMASEEAKQSIMEIIEIGKSQNICLLCYERDHTTCHRKIVADAISGITGQKTRHLGVREFERAE